MNHIEINARWREEVVASASEGNLVFEFTMGQEHLFFPSEARWLELAPAWAKDKWQLYRDACQRWCEQHRYPISIVSDTHFYEEK
jgi:hypothetical protein